MIFWAGGGEVRAVRGFEEESRVVPGFVGEGVRVAALLETVVRESGGLTVVGQH